MNVLETRLSARLHDRASVASPDDRLDDVLDGVATYPVTRQGRSRRGLAVVGVAVAVVLGVVGVWVAAGRDDDDPGVADASSTTAPEAGVATTALVATTRPPQAPTPIEDRWDQVAASMIDTQPNWALSSVESTSSAPTNFSGVIVAAVGRGVVIIDAHAFGPGEYRADPVWQQETAGAAAHGVTIAEGTLFTVDQVSPLVRQVDIVSAAGIVTVHVENIPAADRPPLVTLTDVARQVTRALPSVLAPGASETGVPPSTLVPSTTVPRDVVLARLDAWRHRVEVLLSERLGFRVDANSTDAAGVTTVMAIDGDRTISIAVTPGSPPSGNSVRGLVTTIEKTADRIRMEYVSSDGWRLTLVAERSGTTVLPSDDDLGRLISRIP